MVVFMVALHPVGNIILGTITSVSSFLASFEITSRCLRRRDANNRDYDSITVQNKIVIDDDNDIDDKNITLFSTVKFKKKVDFNKVVHFRSIPNKEESPKSDLWYSNNDYLEFKNNEVNRRNSQYNLQQMMAQQEEDKHLDEILTKMQQKEYRQELERIKREKRELE